MKPSPRATIWSLLPVLSAALLATATQSYSAVTMDFMVSNLTNTDSGNLPVSNLAGADFQANTLAPVGAIFQANTFTTGSSATQLISVTLSMAAAIPNQSGGFFVSIYSSSPTGPSALLAILMGPNNPAAAGLYTYTAGSPLPLAANTSYFVVAAVPPYPASPQEYRWNFSTSVDQFSANGWSIGDNSWIGFNDVTGGATSLNGGTFWTQNQSISAAKFSVQALDASAIPEPGLMLPLPVLLASGLMLRLRRK